MTVIMWSHRYGIVRGSCCGLPLGPGRGGDRYWSALVAEVNNMIWQAVWAGFDYFQREAGYTWAG